MQQYLKIVEEVGERTDAKGSKKPTDCALP